jgi:hypothetical protein
MRVPALSRDLFSNTHQLHSTQKLIQKGDNILALLSTSLSAPSTSSHLPGSSSPFTFSAAGNPTLCLSAVQYGFTNPNAASSQCPIRSVPRYLTARKQNGKSSADNARYTPSAEYPYSFESALRRCDSDGAGAAVVLLLLNRTFGTERRRRRVGFGRALERMGERALRMSGWNDR